MAPIRRWTLPSPPSRLPSALNPEQPDVRVSGICDFQKKRCPADLTAATIEACRTPFKFARGRACWLAVAARLQPSAEGASRGRLRADMRQLDAARIAQHSAYADDAACVRSRGVLAEPSTTARATVAVCAGPQQRLPSHVEGVAPRTKKSIMTARGRSASFKLRSHCWRKGRCAGPQGAGPQGAGGLAAVMARYRG